MSQQLGIVLIVDVGAALQAGSLKGCTYFFDNAGGFGTTGMGTDKLVSAINGTYWLDGSQASEHVLNFIVIGTASLPITLPHGYKRHRARQQERKALAAVRALAEDGGKNNAKLQSILGAIRPPRFASIRHPTGTRGEILLDHLGEPVLAGEKLDSSAVAELPPIIAGITGEAVERGIIYPAQYGSPNVMNGGWYWSAAVATQSPGLWSCTLHLVLYRLAGDVWEPVPMTIDANLNITSQPMRNGFTGGGLGLLPVGRSGT